VLRLRRPFALVFLPARFAAQYFFRPLGMGFFLRFFVFAMLLLLLLFFALALCVCLAAFFFLLFFRAPARWGLL
jgi:hypothetical protein